MMLTVVECIRRKAGEGDYTRVRKEYHKILTLEALGDIAIAMK